MGWLTKVRSTIHKKKAVEEETVVESAVEEIAVEETTVKEVTQEIDQEDQSAPVLINTEDKKTDKKIKLFGKRDKIGKKDKKKKEESDEIQVDDAFDQEPVDETQPLLIVKGVERSFQVGSQQLRVLKGIDMTLYPKQLIMLRGRSGSGKTTLMNILGGLDQPNEGEVLFRNHPFHIWNDDQRTEIRRREIGYIFQTFALMPLLSAYENVELGLRMAGVPRHLWKHRVKHCMQLVGLEKRMHHRPFEMSGGEQQRVAIAKAIVHRPNLLLADEPTADLDSQMSAQIMSVFRSIVDTEKVTICMTTHDPTILEVADHVLEMVDGKFKQA
jgi:putative ABC transport system ATP-binding protein